MKAIKNTGILLLSEIFSKGIAFLLIPLYSYLVVPEDFGIVAILQLLFTIFVLFASFSLNNTFTKFYFDRDFISIKSLFTTILVIQFTAIIFGCVLYLFLGNTITRFLEINNKEYLDLVFFSSILAVFFPIVMSYLICSGQVKRAGIYSIIISFIRSVTALVLVIYMQDKVFAILIAIAIEHFIGFCISIYYYLQNLNFKLLQIMKIKELISYSVIFFPTSLSVLIVKFSDRFMIQFLIGYQSLGVYSMGTTLVNIPGQFISTINKNFTPQIYQSLNTGNRKDLNQLIRFFLTTIFVLLFGLLLFSKEIFYLIGDKYQQSYYIFLILCLCSYINGYNLIIQPIMTYFKKYVKHKSIIWVSVGILNIVLNIVFIPLYGIMGAAVVTTFSYLCSIPFSYYYAKKANNDNYHIDYFVYSLLLFVLTVFYVMYSHENHSIAEFIIRFIFFWLISYFFVDRLVNFKDLLFSFKKLIARKKVD